MTERYCTLKDIVPGSVIEMPEELGKGQALVLGLEYQSDKKSIATFVIRDGSLYYSALPIYDDSKQFLVKDNAVMQTGLLAKFLERKVPMPMTSGVSGCDPEIFVEHGDGSIFPAWEFLPCEADAELKAMKWLLESFPYGAQEIEGAKWAIPSNVICPKRVKAYWDGVQAEFAPFAKQCLETLHCGTREGLLAVLTAARKKDPHAKLTLRNVVELPEELLQNAEGKYLQFQCSKSYNIYGDEGGGLPDYRDYRYRAAGGHIHHGYDRGLTAPGTEQAIRGLDAVLGVAGVCLAAGIDNPERRRTYGRAGEFRLPAHGIEYRVLSNFWLSHPAIAHLVFDLARVTVRFTQSGFYHIGWIAPEEEVREVINNCDVVGARKIIDRNAPILEALLHKAWDIQPINYRGRMVKAGMNTIMNGIGTIINDPFDIEGNWKLDTPELWKEHCRGEGDSWFSLTTQESHARVSTSSEMPGLPGDGTGLQSNPQQAH